MKVYVPVGNFERQTSFCPTYLAWMVLDEVRQYFRRELPEQYADVLVERAEAVLVKNPLWRRRYESAAGREYLLGSMRHWLAGMLAKEQPALYRHLPTEFKLGQSLPVGPFSWPKMVCPQKVSASPRLHFVHGGELLAA